MTLTEIKCPTCGGVVEKYIGHVNRANKMGLKLYCGRKCAGIGRRSNKDEATKKREKKLYDVAYRHRNLEKKKKYSQDYHKRTYDPIKAAIERKKRMPKHVEYCRQPKYKEYKRQYDKVHRAKKMFGEYWESGLLIMEIEALYDAAEVRQVNNLHNKSQKRKRKWQQLQKLNYLQAK